MTFVNLRLVGLISLLFIAPLATANHPQNDAGRTLVFDHVTGNEWWVEVALSGQGASSVVKVEAMDTNGPWVTLTKRSWGPYAASFHIEPGHLVMFRATWSDGARQTSCWFTHPAGAEQCSTPPTPWRTTHIGEGGLASSSGDMAISDADNDGRRDVVLASNTGLRLYEWTGSSWTTELLSSLSLGAVAAGDGDGDGRNEIYALDDTSVSGTVLHVFSKTSTGWTSQPLFGFPESHAGDMTLGNIDAITGPELYVGLYDTECDPETHLCSSVSSVYWVRREPGSSVWAAQRIMQPSGHLDSMWIGDGDRNGTPELYVGHGTRHADRTTQIARHRDQWVWAELPGWGSSSGMALVVVGDGDRDGKSEVYVANWDGSLRRLTYDPVQGWSNEVLIEDHGYGPLSLFLGDADADGSQELYMTVEGGALVQMRWTGTTWATTPISDPEVSGHEGRHALLVVGDGDGDGRSEAYMAVGFLPPEPTSWETGTTRVYKVEVPRSLFDATFSGVRGNEWWIQANVAATGGTLASVDVRLNGGTWQPLAKQSWGAWAASYRIPQGTIVQLRATSTTGATDLSACYRWIPPSNTDASVVACDQSPPPTFDATFSGVKGNEWWVQANVAANQPLAGVDVRVNCGSTWRAMKLESWGGWTASFHIPSGSKVDFRARSTTGATDLSGGYIWPQATTTSPC